MRLETIKFKNKYFFYRTDTKDKSILEEVFLHDSYLSLIHLNKQQNWLDIGANIGSFSVAIFDKVYRINAYEPERQNFEILRKNLNLNRCPNAEGFEEAITGNDDSEISFYVYEGTNKAVHTTLTTGENRREVKVKAKNIVNILQKYPSVNIKMDIEGGEYDVIKAIHEANLFDKIDQLIFEYHFSFLEDWPQQTKFKELQEILEPHFDSSKTKIIKEDGQLNEKYEMRICYYSK